MTTTMSDRFRNVVETLFARAFDGAGPTDATRYALAVSGGPDSMAMLALARAAFPGSIAVATFDHRLRDASAGEAALVAAACATLGVPHTTLTPSTPIAGASIQRQAREARYAALIAWAADRPLLTAHHADDQAETLLMRLNRASGLAGMAGIRAVRRDGATAILRPLLAWRRAELRVIAEGSGLGFVDDPSNADPRHDRTRIRALLAATPGLDPRALAASVAYLGDAEAALSGHVDTLWAQRWHGPDRGIDAGDLPREVRRRLLRRALAQARAAFGIVLPAFGESRNVEALLDALEGGVAAVQAGVKVAPVHGVWTFRPAPPRRSP